MDEVTDFIQSLAAETPAETVSSDTSADTAPAAEGADASVSTPEPAAVNTAEGSQDAAQDGQPEKQPSTVPATTTTQQTGAGQPSAGLDPNLKATLDSLKETIQQVSKQQPKEEAHPATPEIDAMLKPPSYAFQINEKLLNGIYDESPEKRAVALSQLLQANNQFVHSQIMQQMSGWFGKQLQELEPRMVQVAQGGMQMQVQQQEVMQDFYGKYPQLNTPVARQVVVNVAKQMMDAGQFTAWNADFRDKLAAQVLGVFTSITGAKQAEATPHNAQPAAKPAAVAPSGNGRSVPSTADKVTQDILSLI